MKKNYLKNIIILFITALISLFFLYLALKKVSWQEFFQYIRLADWSFIILALLFFILGYFIRTFRWRFLFGQKLSLPFYPSFEVLVASFAINNVLPLRAGEIARLFLMKKRTDIPKSLTLGTLIIERIFDGVILIILTLLSLWVIKPEQTPLALIRTVTILFGILVICIFLADKIYQPLKNLLIQTKFGQKEVVQKIINKMNLFITSFQNCRQDHILFSVLSLSFLVWLAEGLTYFFIAQSLNLEINYWQSLLVLGIVNFGILIPAAPGYIGTFEYFTIFTLTILGIDKAASASYAVILHLVEYLPITLFGSYVVWKMGLSFLNPIKKSKVYYFSHDLTREQARSDSRSQRKIINF